MFPSTREVLWDSAALDGSPIEPLLGLSSQQGLISSQARTTFPTQGWCSDPFVELPLKQGLESEAEQRGQWHILHPCHWSG